MADDGWNGLDLLWEAALSRESADVDLSDVVSSETTSSTPAVTLLSSPGQLSMTLPVNQPKGSGISSRPSVTCGHPAQVHDAPSVSPTSASSLAAPVHREINNRKRLHGSKPWTSDAGRQRRDRDSEAEKTVEERMDSDTTAPRPKLTREKETYERLLAVDDTNPYQYPPGKECTLAWKVALRHSLRNTYQPTEPELMLKMRKKSRHRRTRTPMLRIVFRFLLIEK
ncbi:hypothetical protein RvY_05455 [Ramazzottius varieornatus]|uniref:Uncharacterized protein n=1 Tax=Ramazzottius varieornatus TaxID=947166 RepID=A0A1D1UV43_RAMVA|nr:hypothetical protein RvY_05455 [Ramazzottius varieornatus]